jgi:signal transduction histidine kinase
MVQQAVLLLQNGRSAVAAVGSIVFLVYALIIGWLFTMIRASDRQRRITAAELTAEREENARRLERLTLANKLHDSALQTLHVIDTDAEDADRVRTLARRQSRELRDLVEGYADGDSVTLRSELMSAISDVEQLFGVEVSAVIRTEVEVDDTVRTLVDASREAMTNAAKYSGVSRIDVYAAMDDGMLTIYVRDEGSGFDPDSVVYGHGVRHSIIERVEDAGGTAELSSAPGQGTEVALSVVVGVARV